MYISTFHSYFQWALRGDNGKPIYPPDEKGIAFLPTENISKPRNHPKHPRPMPRDDIRKAIDMADPKMRCWILLGAYEGMRCQEIAFLSREDINEETGTLHIVRGKGDKMRYVPIHPEVLDALKALPWPSEGRCWPGEDGETVSRRGNRFLHGVCNISATMHQLRHFAGTSWYQDSGGDIVLTSGLLGHASIATTQTYAAADVSKASGIVAGITI